MPPRRANGVTGPSSALTSFLREQGITGGPAPTWRNQPHPNVTVPSADLEGLEEEIATQDDEQAVASGSRSVATTSGVTTPSTSASGSRAGSKRRVVELSDSDDLDGDESLIEKTALKKKALALKKRGKIIDSDDDDFSQSTVRKAKPGIGSMTPCGECERMFPVTKYTVALPDDPDLYLCHKCATAAKLIGPGVKKVAPKKKVERRKVVAYEQKQRIAPLLDVCIQFIADNVGDVESLGSLSGTTRDRVNAIICKNRKMTAETAPLFFSFELEELRMNDCSLIKQPGFFDMSALCPNLRSLHLNMCGQLRDDGLLNWGDKLHSLQRIELYAPFLVRKAAWISFLQKCGSRLEGFFITQSPRFDLDCVNAMIESCPDMKELRLAEMGKLDDSWLTPLSHLTSLWRLELSNPAVSLPPDAPNLPTLFTALGPSLKHLSLGSHDQLTNEALLSLIPENCPLLSHLDLTLLPLLEDESTAELFDKWAEAGNAGLETVILTGCHQLKGQTFDALVRHSGPSVRVLSLSGWRDLEEEKAREIGNSFPRLEMLDIGWCRQVTNFTLKAIVDSAPNLKRVTVWGCNALDNNHPRRKGLEVIGVETHEFRI